MDERAAAGWVEPQLASATPRRAFDDQWQLERKLDGVRLLAVADAGQVRLLTRNRNDVTRSWPEVAACLAAQVGVDSFIIDGEVVAFTDDQVGGHTDFGRLQQRIHLTEPRTIARTGVPVWFYAFDLLHFDRHDVRTLPQTDRTSALTDVAGDWDDVLRLVDQVPTDATDGPFKAACSAGWEGLLAKRKDAPYRSGRSTAWLKLKCIREQEFVVGGWLPPKGSRHALGALLVGYHEPGDSGLVYAGSVGTGFTDVTLIDLRNRLDALAADSSPFQNSPADRAAVWVHPDLVVQVAFSEWTAAGRLRHPSYQGLRLDKRARAVLRKP